MCDPHTQPASLAVPCPDPRCQAEPGQPCLRLNRPAFPGQRNVRQAHTGRVRLAGIVRRVTAGQHAGLTDPTVAMPGAPDLFTYLVNNLGHREGNRLWHAGHDALNAHPVTT